MIRKIRNWLWKNARWLYDLTSPVFIYFINSRNHTHYFPTGVSRGAWMDTVYRLQYAMEWAFVDFLENEFTPHVKEWNDGVWGSDTYANVLKALDIEASMDTGHQAEAAKIAKRTYKYIKVYRPKVERLELGYLDLWYETSRPDDGSWHPRKRTPKTELYFDRHGHWLDKREAWDQEALHNIVEIRRWMWT